MEIVYDDKYGYVDGYRFRKNVNSGYYLSSKAIGEKRMDLHRYIWFKYNGEIPKGMEIHHKDMNKDNNEISNLQMMTADEHRKWHGRNYSEELKQKWIKNLEENARPKAAEWHGGEEGKKWHSKNSIECWNKREFEKHTCIECGSEFESRTVSKAYFCTPKCRTKNRVKSGVDNVTKICVICSGEFVANKYYKPITCSRSCGGKLARRKKENK